MSDCDPDFFDMGQPLKRVKPNASFKLNPDALDDKPKMAKLVASIFAHWALIEQRLSLLVVRVLGADAAPAIAMFSTLTAQHLQMGALEAAAKVALIEPDEIDSFNATIKITDAAQGPRNKLAHWMWGTSHELPDVLLLAEPRTQRERDRELMLALKRGDSEGFNLLEMARLNNFDPDTIVVYRLGDLKRAQQNLAEAQNIVSLLCVYLDPLLTGLRKPKPNFEPRELRDQLFAQLLSKRLFRAALDLIRAARKNTHQSPPGSQPKEPRGS